MKDDTRIDFTVVLTAGQLNPARCCEGLKYCHFAIHAVPLADDGIPHTRSHRCSAIGQIPSSTRGTVSLIDSSRLNEVQVISIVMTAENAGKCLAKWGDPPSGGGTFGDLTG
jgi:hypothetical protein